MPAAPQIIHLANYRVLEIGRLPRDLRDKLLVKLEIRNGDYTVCNPTYHAELAQWLREQGENPDEIFLAHDSW
jgi:hypothetical protein